MPLTKEQLFACLKYDGVSRYRINQARNNDRKAFFFIGCLYKTKIKDYSKAIAWFQLGANQNDSGAQFNIAFFYENGLGVSQDYPTAMEYYLKAAENNHTIAMSHIGLLFLNEKDVPLDKYKALEWLVKSGNEPGKVEELNKAGFHLDEEDKNKKLYQMIEETYRILREDRMKKESKLKQENQELMKLKSLNEEGMEYLLNEYIELQHENQQNQQQIALLEQEKNLLKQSNTRSEQHIKEKEHVINSLVVANDALSRLVQLKTIENDLRKKDRERFSNLEQSTQELKIRVDENRQLVLESISLPDNLVYDNNYTNDNNSSDIINNNIKSDKQQEHQKKTDSKRNSGESSSLFF